MTLRDKFTQEINYLELGFIIVCSAILKSLWMIYIDNLAYRVVGLNRESAYHTFIVAIMATIIFLSFISIFNNATAGFNSEPTAIINPLHPPNPSNPSTVSNPYKNEIDSPIVSDLNTLNPSKNEMDSPIISDLNTSDTWYLEPLQLESLYPESLEQPIRLPR